MAEPITIDEIMCELERIDKTVSAEGASVVEIMRHTGKDKHVIRKLIAEAMDAGTMACTRVLRPAIDGTRRFVPLYRVVKKAGKK